MLPFRLDELTSKDTAVKTGSVKHGMLLQACRNLHLLDNRLRLHRGSMHVAVKRCKTCTGRAYQPEGFHVRTPQQQGNLTRKHSASKQPGGAPLTDFVSPNKKLLANQRCSAIMLPQKLDEITSKHTAVKTGSVKHGMPLQACRNLHLLDNRLRLHSSSMHVAVESSKCSTGKA